MANVRRLGGPVGRRRKRQKVVELAQRTGPIGHRRFQVAIKTRAHTLSSTAGLQAARAALGLLYAAQALGYRQRCCA